MKMSLIDWRKAWWELIDSCQGPSELLAKPTDSQKVGEKTKLRYGKQSNKSRRCGNPAVG
jgi:hypothetical protein